MPSDSMELLRSIRRWLLVTVFLLGICVVTVADAGYVVSDYQDGLIFGVAGLIGALVALIAGLRILGTFASSTDTEGTREQAE